MSMVYGLILVNSIQSVTVLNQTNHIDTTGTTPTTCPLLLLLWL